MGNQVFGNNAFGNNAFGFQSHRFLVALSVLGLLSFLSTTLPAMAESKPAAGPTASHAAIDPASLVDPELRPALAKLPQGHLPPDTNFQTLLPTLRQMMAAIPPQLTEKTYAEQTIPGSAGMPDVRIYIINAKPGGHRPAILHTHGGGFIMGTAAHFLPDLQTEAQALDAVIVSVDYRLAPDTPFPGPLEDNYAALKWLYANADKIGADPNKIALQGESAGGGLTAMLAIAARDRHEVPVKFQLLVYPMLDDHTGSTVKPPAHLTSLIWSSEANRYAWSAFLGKPAGSDDVPVGSVPARVEDLSGLPPTFVGVGALDMFVQEDISYAKRLIEAGVPTELLVVPGAYHAFEIFAPNASVSQRFTLAKYNALARAFGEPEITSLNTPNTKSPTSQQNAHPISKR